MRMNLVFGQAWWVASRHTILNRMLMNVISLGLGVFFINLSLFTVFFLVSILRSLVAFSRLLFSIFHFAFRDSTSTRLIFIITLD